MIVAAARDVARANRHGDSEQQDSALLAQPSERRSKHRNSFANATRAVKDTANSAVETPG